MKAVESPFFLFSVFIKASHLCDAQLRVKRGSGGLGAEPSNKQIASGTYRCTACENENIEFKNSHYVAKIATRKSIGAIRSNCTM